MARIVIDPEELNQLPAFLQKENTPNTLLLCVRILHANYHENQPKTQSVLQKWKQSVSSIFTGDNNYYHFNMNEEKHFAM